MQPNLQDRDWTLVFADPALRVDSGFGGSDPARPDYSGSVQAGFVQAMARRTNLRRIVTLTANMVYTYTLFEAD